MKEYNNLHFKETLQNLKTVFNHLNDDLSKEVFKSRLEYNITNEYKSLQNIILTAKFDCDVHRSVTNNISEIHVDNNETIILYGAGRFAHKVLDELLNKFPLGKYIICDQNWKNIVALKGIQVIDPNEALKKYSNSKVVIANINNCTEILDNLISMNMDINIIYTANCIVYKKFAKGTSDQYYPENIITFGKKEIFVDGGAFNGKNTADFAQRVPNYEKIFTFEPTAEMKAHVQNNICGLRDVDFYSLGLWDEEDVLGFSNQNGPGNSISQERVENTIEVNSIDNICGDAEVTFIKMDIEGAELKALMGAKKTITRYKPKLAICIYHKPEDIVEIPLYIKSLVPEYKIYMRHHSNSMWETVLYAVI